VKQLNMWLMNASIRKCFISHPRLRPSLQWLAEVALNLSSQMILTTITRKESWVMTNNTWGMDPKQVIISQMINSKKCINSRVKKTNNNKMKERKNRII
jgi:hypothetical protein